MPLSDCSNLGHKWLMNNKHQPNLSLYIFCLYVKLILSRILQFALCVRYNLLQAKLGLLAASNPNNNATI